MSMPLVSGVGGRCRPKPGGFVHAVRRHRAIWPFSRMTPPTYRRYQGASVRTSRTTAAATRCTDSGCACAPAPGAPSCPRVAARAARVSPSEPPWLNRSVSSASVLSAPHRLTRGDDLRRVSRQGRRCGGDTLVLHLLRPPGGGVQRPTQVGFVVSRGVGNSVVRHRVQRRLRHLL